MPIIFHMPPWRALYLFGDKAISVTVKRYFWQIYGEKLECLVNNQERCKLHQKCLITVTKITLFLTARAEKL